MIAVPDFRSGVAFHDPRKGVSMNARMPSRPDRLERVFRSMLGLALIAGVVWALAHGTPGAGPGGLLR